MVIRRDAGGAQDATEARRVMMQSIVTAVQRRDPNSDRFALPARQRSRAVHQFEIEVVVQSHDQRVNAVDLENVVPIRHAFARRQL